MTKRTYLVLLFGAPVHIPQGICGASGKLYGNAPYVAEHNAHALKIPGEVWEPSRTDKSKKGAGRDILSNTRRRAQINVVCLTEVDPHGADLERAQENDVLKQEIETLRALVANPAPPVFEDVPIVVEPATTANVVSRIRGQEDSGLRARLDALEYRPLRDIALRINEERGAGLELKKLTRAGELADALASLEYIADYLPALEPATA